MRASDWFTIPLSTNGVIELEVTYKSGTGTSKEHLPTLNDVLAQALGCVHPKLYAGSLNLWADEALALPAPASVELGGFTWHLVPIVLGQSSVGIVARRADSGDIEFLEVFACERLSTLLKLSSGDRIKIRLLPGRYLDLAA